MPGQAREPGCAQQPACSLPAPGLAAEPGEQRGPEQWREQVGEDETAAGSQNPGALPKACQLVLPVVERCRADDEVEGAIIEGEPFGRSDTVAEAAVIGCLPSSRDHGWRRIDPRQLAGLWVFPREPPQQVAGPAADVEYAHGSGAHRYSEIRRTVGDVMVKAAEPALLITGRTFLERGDIAVRWHSGSLAGAPSAVDGNSTGA